MKSRFGRWLFYGFAALAVGLAVAYMGLSMLARQQREHALARLQLAVPEQPEAAAGDAEAPAGADAAPSPAGDETSADAARARVDALWVPGGAVEMLLQAPAWHRWNPVERENLTAADWAALASLLEEHAALLVEIRVIAERGFPGHPHSYSFDPMLILMSPLFTFADFLSADALVAVRQRDYERAAQDVIAMLRLWRSGTVETRSFGLLLRAGQVRGALVLLEEWPPGALSPEQAARLVAALDDVDFRIHVAQAIQFKAETHANMFDELRANGRTKLRFSYHPRQGPAQDAIGAFYSSIGQPLIDLDEARYLDTMGRLAEASKRPHYEVRPLLESIEADGVESLWRPLSGRAATLVSSLSRIAETEAQLDLAQLGLLVEQYAQEHGVPPEALEEIAGGMPGGIPVDPFTGEPYRYTVEEDGFSLYSVGRDLEDDGGVHDPDDGDLVWRGSAGGEGKSS